MASNKRILIVDDQQDLREQMAKLLSRSTKKSETVSLVRQMRSRLLGSQAQAQSDDSDDEPERGGYEVDTASQGQEALEKVKRALETGKPYAAMFLDMRMPPGWDGLETAKRIREVDKLIEIVIMTAYADHDQETVAKSVGSPDKLLYIKKPFQSEEIFQLALCLTSKWSAEEDERFRKGWLEGLIRGMSRIKGVKTDKPEDVCASVMKSLLTFIGSQKGLIATLADGKWKLEHAAGLDAAEAGSFINANAAKLTESHTAQSVGGKYLLPLKRERYSAVAVIYESAPPSDPEWYKLLNLLVMTASEALCSASLQDELRRGERLSALSVASAKISANFGAGLEKLAGELASLKSSAKDEASQKSLAAFEAGLAALRKSSDSLAKFGVPPAPAPAPVKTQLAQTLKDLAAELKNSVPAGLAFSCEAGGLPSAEALCSPDLLKEGLKAVVSERLAAAVKAGAASLSLKIELKAENGAIKIVLEDDGPLLDKASAFEPFLASSPDSFGLALPLAKRQLKAAGASLGADFTRQTGSLLCVSLPAANSRA